MNSPLVIGLCGGSATGKTFFLHQLRAQFSEQEICIISQDDYYLAQEQQRKDPNGIINYDLPEAIDHEYFASDLRKVIQGESVYKKEYTFNKPNTEPRLLHYRPAPVIIVEGIFIYHYPKVAGQMDFKLFLESKEEIKVQRRLQRDLHDRNYDEAHVHYTQQHHVLPAYEKYIAPYRDDCDLVILNNERGCQNALTLLKEFIQAHLNT